MVSCLCSLSVPDVSSSATNRIIVAKDRASVQINFAAVDEDGVYTGAYSTYVLSGYVRQKGESDGWLTMLAARDGISKPVFNNDFQH